MDLHYRREITVGALVVAGVALFILGSLWLSGRTIGSRPMITIQFSDVETLKSGSPVKVSGVPMGTVESIDYQEFGRVLVRASMEPRMRLKQDATAILSSTGLVADAVVNLNPGTSATPLAPNAVIPGTVEGGLLSNASELSTRANDALAGVSAIANKQLAQELTQTLQAVQRLASLYGNRETGPSAELTRTLTELRQMRTQLDSTLISLNLAGRVATADTLMRNLSSLSASVGATSARFDTLLARVNRGEGSLGQLMSDTTFYVRARETLRSVQEFIDDIRKHPGKLGITVRIF